MGSVIGRPVGRPNGLRKLVTKKRGKAPTQQSVRTPQPLADTSIHEADSSLLTRLKDVYVDTSSTAVTRDNLFASERAAIKKPDNLPQDRTFYTEDAFAVSSSSVGFVTYSEVLEILNKRESETKEEWTADIVAEKYKIEPSEAANLMKYFSAYKLSAQSPNEK